MTAPAPASKTRTIPRLQLSTEAKGAKAGLEDAVMAVEEATEAETEAELQEALAATRAVKRSQPATQTALQTMPATNISSLVKAHIFVETQTNALGKTIV